MNPAWKDSIKALAKEIVAEMDLITRPELRPTIIEVLSTELGMTLDKTEKPAVVRSKRTGRPASQDEKKAKAAQYQREYRAKKKGEHLLETMHRAPNGSHGGVVPPATIEVPQIDLGDL